MIKWEGDPDAKNGDNYKIVIWWNISKVDIVHSFKKKVFSIIFPWHSENFQLIFKLTSGNISRNSN